MPEGKKRNPHGVEQDHGDGVDIGDGAGCAKNDELGANAEGEVRPRQSGHRLKRVVKSQAFKIGRIARRWLKLG
ncbi:hypothetical protein K1719_008348 [Acacia pycnantha]|nr:hypothetical protein K1719_008348 [Acacia pycnantha]